MPIAPWLYVLAFYSDTVGPFSYEKLANVQSNSVSGGMEAASAIFYSEGSVTGDRSVRWRNVVILEIAHQWFGNAVTESDWDDVWLSEGFATYFTLLYVEHAYGRDLRVFFDQWPTRGGLVRLNGDWSYRADTGTLAIRLAQRDRARTFSMPLQVGVYAAGSTAPTVTSVQLAEASHEFQIALGQRPDRVVLDPNHFVLMESALVEAKR